MGGFSGVLSGLAARGPAISDLMGRAGQALTPAMSTAQKNAQAWNTPGGGYDQWKQGDAQRAQQLPIGGTAPQQAEPPMSGFDNIRNDLSQIRNGPSVKYKSNAPFVQSNPTSPQNMAPPLIPSPAAPPLSFNGNSVR